MDPASTTNPPTVVGRGHVFAALDEQRDASTVAGRVVVLSGEAGIGKSAVMRTFNARARTAGFAVVEGSCVELERRRPLGAFVDVFADCVRTFGAGRLRDIAEQHSLFLDPLWDDLAVGAPTTSPEDRFRVYASMLSIIASLSHERPLIVSIEDLHWADDASIELFTYLARRLARHAALLIGTYRSDDAGHRDPVRSALAELAAARLATDISLAPLDTAAVLDMLRHDLGERVLVPGLRRDIADAVREHCGGNPLLIEETIDVLRGHIDVMSTADRAAIQLRLERIIPRSVNEATLARTERLSAHAQQVLAAASVTGDRVDIPLVVAVTGFAEEDVNIRLFEAVEARVLVDGEDGIRFRHALTREAIRLGIHAWDRKRLHERVALELERRGARPQELAYHFDEAGLSGRAVTYYEQAATAAIADTPAATTRALERAIDLTADDDPRRPRLLARFAQSLLHDGRNVAAVEAAEAAIELSRRLADPASQIEAGLALVQVYQANEAWAQEEALLRELLERMEPQGASAALASAYTELGICVLMRSVPDALELSRRAIEVAERVDARRELVHALQMHAVALMHERRPADAVTHLERALSLARETAPPRLQRSVMHNLAEARAELGEEPEAQRERREEIRAFARLHQIRAVRVQWQELDSLFADGDWDALLERASEIDERLVILSARASAYAAIANAARQGLENSRNRLRSIFEQLCAHDLAGFGASTIGLAELVGGDLADAKELATRAIASTRDHPRFDPDFVDIAALVAAISARLLGDKDSARAMATRARDYRAAVDHPRFVASNVFARAELARMDGAYDAAIAAYGEAAYRFRCRLAHPWSWLESLANLYQAEVRVERDKDAGRDEAQRDLDAALVYWRDAKATHYLRLFRQRALKIGLSFPADLLPEERAAHHTDPLTKRQREIAMLVARGLTNREIAESMTLSVRTIDSHVDQIRAKLNFHTRAQIAAWVVERYGPQER